MSNHEYKTIPTTKWGDLTLRFGLIGEYNDVWGFEDVDSGDDWTYGAEADARQDWERIIDAKTFHEVTGMEVE